MARLETHIGKISMTINSLIKNFVKAIKEGLPMHLEQLVNINDTKG